MCSCRRSANGSASSASRVLVTQPRSDQAMKHRYSPASSSFCVEAVSTLDPFAMHTAFPCSDYYGSSAPLRRHQPATGLPHPAGRDQRKWFPRSLSNPSTGSVPSYAPATSPRLRRSPSPWPPCWRHLPAQEFPDRPDPSGVRCNPALICQVGAGGLCLRGFSPLVPRVHLSVSLAGPTPSDSAGVSRRCQGCFHPCRCPSGRAALSFSQPAATG